MYMIIITNARNTQWWQKGEGFTRDITLATVYDSYRKAASVAQRIKRRALIDDIENYEFNAIIYKCPDNGTWNFSHSFTGWEATVSKATNTDYKLLFNNHTITDVFRDIGMFKDLDITLDSEAGCFYAYFANKEDCLEFCKRLKKLIWPEWW